jgi:hypothetical protein
MRKVFMAFAAVLPSAAVPALAHPHGADESPVRAPPPINDLAQAEVRKLVAFKKLPSTWQNAKFVKRELRTKDGAVEWVVTFQNDAERSRAKKFLYVIMTPSGLFVSADHNAA